jgi:putative FmdB family regulatory protein
MPIYEYYCADCGNDFEVMRSVSRSDEPANCEKCGKPAVRQLSNFAFKSNTFTSPKFKASLEKPLRTRDGKPTKDSS